jgi:hypothetical protein
VFQPQGVAGFFKKPGKGSHGNPPG